MGSDVVKLLISAPLADQINCQSITESERYPELTCIPDTDSLVVAAAEELLVVWGVHHLLDAARVTLELDDRLTGLLQVKYPEE